MNELSNANGSSQLLEASLEQPVVRDAKKEAFAQALTERLKAGDDGRVRFGAPKHALHPSQVEAMTAMRDAVQGGESIMYIVQPGGSGKTWEGILAGDVTHEIGGNSLFIVPSQDAIRDFSQKARVLCPEVDIGTVYQPEKRIGRITFITYASLLRCMLGESAEAEACAFEDQEGEAHPDSLKNGSKIVIDPSEYHLVIWDEAHKYLTRTAQGLIARFRHAINVGLTATPRYYSGKEVAKVFGENIYNLDLQRAVERKEISDFRNLLVTTDVVTGLHLTSPEQEENPEVTRAINVMRRNKIFPDMYKNAQIDVNGKKHTLLGEPALAFVAQVDHAHDLAQEFNDALMPQLRTNKIFREKLQAKGINPDEVEQIAAPIHTGSTKQYSGMNLMERNALVERYHQRKVLVLVATSVLQQSFDSKSTSVVFDTIPRQSYVSVGQGGMRALRFLEGKEMAFIINTQDADHESLTFLDFQAQRGNEEGVIVEIADTAGGSDGEKPTIDPRTIASYKVAYGSKLVDLASRRVEEGGQMHSEGAGSYRHFTLLGYQRLHEFMADIVAGKPRAAGQFWEITDPWRNYTSQRIQAVYFPSQHPDQALLDEAADDLFFTLVERVASGQIETWQRFSSQYISDLKRRFCRLQRTRAHFAKVVSLDDEVPNRHVQSHMAEQNLEERSMINEEVALPLHETLPALEEDHLEKIDRSLLAERIDNVLRTLTDREREIIKLRYGLGDGHAHALDEVAGIFEVTRERVRQIETKGMRKLRQWPRVGSLEAFVGRGYSEPRHKRGIDERMEELDFHAKLLRQVEERIDKAKQQELNERLMREMHQDFEAPKRELREMLKLHYSGGLGIPIGRIATEAGVPSKLVAALVSIEWTNTQELFRALEPEVIEKLITVLRPLYEGYSSNGRNYIGYNEGLFRQAIRHLRVHKRRFLEFGGKPA